MSDTGMKRKNPVVALILSGIFPGLGQMYNAQILKGAVLAAINIVINVLIYTEIDEFIVRLYRNMGYVEVGPEDMPAMLAVLGYSAVWLILLLYAVIDAKRTADRLNEQRGL